MQTKLPSVAKAQPDELISVTAAQAEIGRELSSGEKLTCGEVISIRKRQLENNPTIKPSTRHYWNQIFKMSGKARQEDGFPFSLPTIKQHFAAIKMVFDYLVTGQVVPINPASSVRGPKYVIRHP